MEIQHDDQTNSGTATYASGSLSAIAVPTVPIAVLPGMGPVLTIAREVRPR